MDCQTNQEFLKQLHNILPSNDLKQNCTSNNQAEEWDKDFPISEQQKQN